MANDETEHEEHEEAEETEEHSGWDRLRELVDETVKGHVDGLREEMKVWKTTRTHSSNPSSKTSPNPPEKKFSLVDFFDSLGGKKKE